MKNIKARVLGRSPCGMEMEIYLWGWRQGDPNVGMEIYLWGGQGDPQGDPSRYTVKNFFNS